MRLSFEKTVVEFIGIYTEKELVEMIGKEKNIKGKKYDSTYAWDIC